MAEAANKAASRISIQSASKEDGKAKPAGILIKGVGRTLRVLEAKDERKDKPAEVVTKTVRVPDAYIERVAGKSPKSRIESVAKDDGKDKLADVVTKTVRVPDAYIERVLAHPLRKVSRPLPEVVLVNFPEVARRLQGYRAEMEAVAKGLSEMNEDIIAQFNTKGFATVEVIDNGKEEMVKPCKVKA